MLGIYYTSGQVEWYLFAQKITVLFKEYCIQNKPIMSSQNKKKVLKTLPVPVYNAGSLGALSLATASSCST